MKSLDAKSIQKILRGTHTRAKLRLHDRKILSTHEIHGCELARDRAQIIEEAVVRILEAMEIPREVTIVAV